MQNRKRIAVLAGGLSVLLGGGVAFAAWTATGSGSGSAQATTAEALTTLDASASTVGQLFPGGDGDVKIDINNNNGYPVRVTDVTANGTVTATGGIGSCTTTGVSFVDQHSLALDIPAHSHQLFTLTNAAHMTNASLNGCQGATFTLPVTLAGLSNAS